MEIKIREEYKICGSDGFWGVFVKAQGFWQQVSKWYFYEKCAINKLNKLIK